METALSEVAQSLGKPVSDIYREFGPPVGAASLAQAHPARLLDGRKVAVKILRPGVEHRIRADIRAMTLCARWAERMGPEARRLEPRALVATVARSLELELDLRLEAAGASELGELDRRRAEPLQNQRQPFAGTAASALRSGEQAQQPGQDAHGRRQIGVQRARQEGVGPHQRPEGAHQPEEGGEIAHGRGPIPPSPDAGPRLRR